MLDLKIKDLLDLVVSDVPDAEIKIQKMYEWHFEKVKMISQFSIGAAASLFISALLTFLQTTSQIDWWKIVLIFIMALSTGTYGAYRIYQLRALHRQYGTSLKLLSEFKKIRPFLLRYRENII